MKENSFVAPDVNLQALDSYEVDDEQCGLNVSSDEDCENEHAHNSQEKKEIARLVRAEESRDFSYVVEVLTEASIFNRNLFTYFSTWHSSQCPISPSIFENLEKKSGKDCSCEQLLYFFTLRLIGV